ncbi:hypothetical protein ABH995_000883 [Bradyrhizobium yuanmingense]
MFACFDRVAEQVGIIAILSHDARLNDIAPKGCLVDVFARIADMPQNRLHHLLPSNWTLSASRSSAA